MKCENSLKNDGRKSMDIKLFDQSCFYQMKYFVLLLLVCVLNACSNNNGGKVVENNSKDSVIQSSLDVEFNADSAYDYVKQQVAFGPRFSGSEGHTECYQYLLKEFAKYADTIYLQSTQASTYTNKVIPIKNIIASINPKADKRIMLAAHWDTRPFADQDTERKEEPILGANDGASGVAVLLEMARQMSKNKPTIGVDFVLFDAEDWGDASGKNKNSFCLGSQYWTKHLHQPYYRADFCILLDMVGSPNAMFGLEGYSLKNAPDILAEIWQTAAAAGYSNNFKNFERPAVVDDHYYIMKDLKIKSVDIIDFDPNTPMKFGKYWHTHADNMDAISSQTLKAVGQTVLNVVYQYDTKSKLKD